MTYQWITAKILRSEDGRRIEIIQTRHSMDQCGKRWFVREITQTEIKDHHFPYIRTFAQIANEARLIAARGDVA